MTQNGVSKGSTKRGGELKIVIVGDGGCGKTSLLMVYAKGDFPEVRRAFMSCSEPHLLILYIVLYIYYNRYVNSDICALSALFLKPNLVCVNGSCIAFHNSLHS